GMAANLKWGGILVLDYLNTALLRNTLAEHETLQADGYTFQITRAIRGNRICKEIRVIESGQCSVFQERVRLYSQQDLCDLFSAHGMELQQVFGNYQLEPFHPDHSDRMIMVFRKKPNPDA
ncbi:MAG TPA: hypothetical protein VFX48_02395, partial [Saprospiraceae bacterium]|nr:hypothetical protein [Saprospiraceae bacterium]